MKRYLSARLGVDLNLSTAELAAFEKLGPSAAAPAVEAQLRSALLASQLEALFGELQRRVN